MVFCSDFFYQSQIQNLGVTKREEEKNLARSSQDSAQSGTPDSVRCARMASGELATLGNSSATYGYNSPDCPVVHQTVR
jgi:hypothetical protein